MRTGWTFMADPAPRKAHAPGPYGQPLTLADQAFVNLAMSLCFWTTDAADRQFIRDVVRDLIPRVNRDHTYLTALVDLTAALVDPDTAPAQHGFIVSSMNSHVREFLRWRGLMALARMQEQDGKRVAE